MPKMTSKKIGEKKVSAKSQTKSSGGLRRAFRNKKIVAVAIFVVIFAGVGSYLMYRSSNAASKNSAIDTVGECYFVHARLSVGSRGNCVRVVQAVINAENARAKMGWRYLNPDGIFGSITESGVKSYQRYVGIGADGIVGDQTWRSLVNTCTVLNAQGWHVWECTSGFAHI